MAQLSDMHFPTLHSKQSEILKLLDPINTVGWNDRLINEALRVLSKIDSSCFCYVTAIPDLIANHVAGFYSVAW